MEMYDQFNPFPNDKILDLSKLKQIANNILMCIQNEKKYVPYRVENAVIKEEIACFKFLLFSQCFSKQNIFSASKCGIVWLWVNH